MTSNIYKIYHNKNNIYERIYVFINAVLNREDLTLEALDALFLSKAESINYNKVFENVFDQEELDSINNFGTKVIFIDDQINLDDTIETIKKKLIKIDPSIAFEAVYLYAKHEQQFTSREVFQKLTQNNKIDLTSERLVQFIINIQDI